MRWKHDFGLTIRQTVIWFLMLVLYIIFLSIITLIYPGSFWLPFGLVLIMALVQYFFSDKLVLMSTGAKIVAEDEYPELHAIIEKLCKEADLPKPRVAIMQSPVPNAFATGRNPKNAVVAVTDSIMRTLNREELEAVLAHELSHVKNRDILTMTVASFLAMVAFLIMRFAFWGSLFNNRDNAPIIIIAIAAAIVGVISMLLMRILSRYREFAADRGSAYITNNPAALKSALYKISGKMQAVPAEKKKEIEGANAFFIIPAISGRSIFELFSTHPPLEKRVAALEKLEEELKK